MSLQNPTCSGFMPLAEEGREEWREEGEGREEEGRRGRR